MVKGTCVSSGICDKKNFTLTCQRTIYLIILGTVHFFSFFTFSFVTFFDYINDL